MDLPRVVMKFGGTSLEDAAAIRRAGDIVERARDRRPAVVVSAAAGVTDTLVEILERAPRESAGPLLQRLQRRHAALLNDLGLEPDLTVAGLAELHNLVRGIGLLHEVTPRTCDLVLSYGERLMAPVFAAHLVSRGLSSQPWLSGELGLITDDRFTRAKPLPETYERIPAVLAQEGDHVPVMTGFMGRTTCGETTTLGRGGSDYSASILARAVSAEELQIWTDVDGILTADPRLVPDARLIDALSFGEASELAFSGAKVLHPSTITPAMEGRIPVRVLNTRAPEESGTLILDSDEVIEKTALRSIAHRTGVQVVTIVSPRMVARHGFISKIANVFDRHSVSINMISTSEISVSLTTEEPPSDFAPLLSELSEFSTVEVESDRGLVSVVGGRLGQEPALVGDIFRTVTESGADVEMISYGATRTNLSFLVHEKDVEDVVRTLHEKYFE